MTQDGGKANETKSAVETVDPDASAQLQDPFPESNFFWRRTFTFLFGAVTFGLVYYSTIRIGDLGAAAPQEGIDALVTVVFYLVVLLGIREALYLIAPSAEQFARWLKTAQLALAGVMTRKTARIDTNQARVSSETTFGRPQSMAGEPIRPSPAPDSQIPESPLSGAPGRPGGHLPIPSDEDYAPRGRS